MFLRLTTQWIMGFGGAIGLNYQSLDFLFRIYKIENPTELFEDIKCIENGALEAMNKNREKSDES